MYQNNSSALYLVLLHALHTFDRVNYCKLFDIMLKRNVCSCTVRLVNNMSAMRLKVKLTLILYLIALQTLMELNRLVYMYNSTITNLVVYLHG